MHITMKSVPDKYIRAKQSGDWWVLAPTVFAVHVREDIPPESQLAVAIHELVEAFLCGRDGVDEEAVVRFDEMYEKEREEGKHKPDDEPGDDPASPYRRQHMAATHVERAVCAALGVVWSEHDLKVTCNGQ